MGATASGVEAVQQASERGRGKYSVQRRQQLQGLKWRFSSAIAGPKAISRHQYINEDAHRRLSCT